MKFIKLKYINWIIGLIVVGIVLYKGLILKADSSGFITAQPIRSAGYPLVILLFNIIFGKFALKVLFVTQPVLILISIHYFLDFLKLKFKLTDFIILLISPLFYFYLYRIGGYIMSDPLSLVFLLLSIKFLLEAVFDNNQKAMFIFYINLIILVLIRGQFYFLYPVTIFVVLFLYFKNRDLKSLVKNMVYLLVVIVLTNVLDKTYHYVKHNRFISTPYTGLQLVTDALYVSKASDSILFKNNEREMFKKISTNIMEQGLTMDQIKIQNPAVEWTEVIFHYTNSYNDICHRNAKVIIGSYFNDPENIDYWKNIDNITLNMARKIILKHPKEFFKLYIYDILRNGFFSNIYFIFFMLILIISLGTVYKDPENKIYLFLVLSSLIVISNLLLVALVEPVLDRYSFYANILYYTSLFIVVANEYLFHQKINNKEESI